jgi:hypothetical protein
MAADRKAAPAGQQIVVPAAARVWVARQQQESLAGLSMKRAATSGLPLCVADERRDVVKLGLGFARKPCVI